MSRSPVPLVTCCLLAAGAASAGTAVSETEARDAISKFLKAPTSPASRSCMKTILEFADGSKDVSVLISRKAVPWPGRKEVRHGEVLLCAFIAGNVRSQLDSGVNKDDPYSGLIQVFRVYRYIKERDRTYAVPEIDALLEKHRAGELTRYLLPDEKAGEAR